MTETIQALNLSDLEGLALSELRSLAQDAGLANMSILKRQELIFRLLQAQAERQGTIYAEGVLEVVDEGFGFLRQQRFLPGPNDMYVSMSQIRRFGLRTGDKVCGHVRP